MSGLHRSELSVGTALQETVQAEAVRKLNSLTKRLGFGKVLGYYYCIDNRRKQEWKAGADMQRKIIAARFFLLLLFFMELCMLSSAKAAVINATTWQYREGGSAADDEGIAAQAGNSSAGWKSFDFPSKPVAPDARIIWLTSRISGDDPTHNMLFFYDYGTGGTSLAGVSADLWRWCI